MSSLKLGNIGSLVTFSSQSSSMICQHDVELIIENSTIIVKLEKN